MKKTVLISVADKDGILGLAKVFKSLGYKIIATEGTGKELEKGNIDYKLADQFTRNPNKLRNCIKTISYYTLGGILFDRSSDLNLKEIEEMKLQKIDILVCNFVSFEKIVKKREDINISNVDVGGPLMVRAAATNFKHVLVVSDPKDYVKVGKALLANKVDEDFRKEMAIKAFSYTSKYDAKLVEYLRKF